MDESKKTEEKSCAALKKEIENLKAMIALQEITIDAYKKSLEMLTVTHEGFKYMAEFYKEKAEKKSLNQVDNINE